MAAPGSDELPSARLVDQRLRNRIMEAVGILADGDEGVRQQGFVEYFESFYDCIPHRDHGGMRPNSAINAEERVCLAAVSTTLDDACDATPGTMTTDDMVATRWPRRVQVVAQRALRLLLVRGRFSEDREQDKPDRPEDS